MSSGGRSTVCGDGINRLPAVDEVAAERVGRFQREGLGRTPSGSLRSVVEKHFPTRAAVLARCRARPQGVWVRSLRLRPVSHRGRVCGVLSLAVVLAGRALVRPDD